MTTPDSLAPPAHNEEGSVTPVLRVKSMNKEKEEKRGKN